MKAAVYHAFGDPNVLSIDDVASPRLTRDGVLVRVSATALNAWDWDLLTGKPFLTRLAGGGLFSPNHPILGSDIAGTVEAVGNDVTRFRPGDHVFGDNSAGTWGGLAELACVPERLLTHKTPTMSFEEAAALPQAGLLALQGLRKKTLAPGARVLINGAGGGFGTFAIQLATRAGGKVTGVDRADKHEVMRALGAEHVIDYAKEDFTMTGCYDLIVDAVGQRSLAEYRRALSPDGTLVLIGGTTPTILRVAAFGSMSSRQKLTVLALRASVSDLEHLANLVETGSLRSVIDRRFSLSQVRDAFAYLGGGHAKGKVVVTIEHNTNS